MIKYADKKDPSYYAKVVTTKQLTSTMKVYGSSSETGFTTKNKPCQLHVITRVPN